MRCHPSPHLPVKAWNSVLPISACPGDVPSVIDRKPLCKHLNPVTRNRQDIIARKMFVGNGLRASQDGVQSIFCAVSSIQHDPSREDTLSFACFAGPLDGRKQVHLASNPGISHLCGPAACPFRAGRRNSVLGVFRPIIPLAARPPCVPAVRVNDKDTAGGVPV